jgi:large subunit ribosomal protein L30
MGKIKVKLVKSVIGVLPKQRATVRSLGLRKIGSSIVHEASPAILGMVKVVSHLVQVEHLKGQES